VSDGTQLSPGTLGDIVSDEDMGGIPRQDSRLPQLGNPQAAPAPPIMDANTATAAATYKLERTKIAQGFYGQDAGDADGYSGLGVRSYFERQALEETAIRETEVRMLEIGSDRRGSSGREWRLDARGGVMRGSTR